MKTLFKIGSKIRRSFDILFDKSEQLVDSPKWRFNLIGQILKDKH